MYQLSSSIPQQHLRSPDILATQTCTEVDLVASSLQNPPIYCDMSLQTTASSSKQMTFYTLIKEPEKRQQPDGEELTKTHQDIPKIEISPVNSSEYVTVLPSSTTTTTTSNNNPPPPTEETNECKKTSDDLDEVMHQISSDLDYLLNGDNELENILNKPIEMSEKGLSKTNSLRRLSKPNLSIEKIDEEDEDDTDSEVVIKGILRTKC